MSLVISDNPVDDAPIWMHNRLDGSIHPALNTADPNITYDSYKQAFDLLKEVAKPDLLAIYKDAENQKQTFIRTVESYNVESKRYGSPPLDIRAQHTWNDVLSLQQGVMAEHELQSSKGFRGLLHKGISRVGNNSESFQAWLKLLPKESHYLSVLCGGLTLLLGAAHRTVEIREAITDIVNDIPLHLSKAKQYLDIFGDSPRLHECSAALYVAILDTLDTIVRECRKHVARSISSRIFKQNLSGQDLLDKIKNIEICADQLASQANIVSMQRQDLMFNGTKDLAHMMISSSRSQDRGFNTIRLGQHDLHEKLQSYDRNLSLVKETLNQCLSFLKSPPVRPATATSSRDYLESGDSKRESGNQQSLLPFPGMALGRAENRKQLLTLLKHLGNDEDDDVRTRDMSAQLNLIYRLSHPSQDRAVALILSSRLQRWLTDTSSCALLINGQMFSTEHETRQSPLSYFCAKLIDGILSQDQQDISNPVFSVCWFCGQHTDVRADVDAHPPGMLSNLLSQLIHQLMQSSVSTTLQDFALSDQHLQLSDLCFLFSQVAGSLPNGTVLFCILDGISYYEDADRRDECMEVFSTLTSLTRQSRTEPDRPLLKLLVTAPLRSHHVQSLFEADEVMNMDEHYPPNGGFSALQWDLSIGGAHDDRNHG